MKKVFVTVNLNANSLPQEGMEDFLRVNIGDLIKESPLQPEEINGVTKANLVLKFINEHRENVLIGFVFSSYEGYRTLHDKLSEVGLKIDKVFIGLDRETNNTYKKLYDLYSSRWLEYPPDFIENLERDSKANLIDLVARLKMNAEDVLIVTK